MAAQLPKEVAVELDVVERVAKFLKRNSKNGRLVFRVSEVVEEVGAAPEKIERVMEVIGRSGRFEIVRRDADSGEARWIVTNTT